MMAVKLVGLIPTYDNPQTIERVARALLAQLGAVLVVDDGSGPDGRAAVERLAGTPGIHVLRRQLNGGKGAAVKDGLRRALELGFTHALQVDADGQHDLAALPALREACEATPAALVLGHPVFDESVPASRKWGRQLTVFWTAVETLGRVIVDPLCGFRVYPLAAANSVSVRGNRMDFDPEVAVRLYWAGTPIVNVPVKVRYLTAEEGGVSHFQLFRDNVRISWMHTTLVVEGALRALWGLITGRFRKAP